MNEVSESEFLFYYYFFFDKTMERGGKQGLSGLKKWEIKLNISSLYLKMGSKLYYFFNNSEKINILTFIT